MSKITEKIRTPIAEEMRVFEKKFHEAMKSEIPLLNRITHYIIHRKGKQIRPMFVFLIAKMLGQISEKTYRMASLIELIHTGTLIHDDVVDDSLIRRGFFSIHALWKNKVAVLVGDYLLSKSLLLAANYDHHDLLKVICRTIREMSEGELLQIEKSRRLDITEEVYEQIIRYKTASLISACCEGGARSVDTNENVALQMQRFGELIGMAFQIKDDLFDYEHNNLVGKPIGIDIKERKITLPLIYTLQKASSEERKWMINTIKNHNKDKTRVRELIDYVKRSGGVDYAVQKMTNLHKSVLKILDQYPENPAKTSLKIMVHYVIERKR
ncbi:MAG: polyprenyl synthetase family protein [Flavobacteriales bacterium]